MFKWPSRRSISTSANEGGINPHTILQRGGYSATPMVNFMSYNSTGLDTVKSAWTRDLCKLTKTDYFSIQEHFMKNKTVNTYFKNQFPDYSTFVIPGFRDKCQDTGRPKGGIAQMSSNKYNIKQTHLPNKTFRVQAQILQFPSTRLLWLNTYFPNDPRTIQFNDDDLLAVLKEIEDLLDTTEFDDLLWAGDLNWDPGRQSGFSTTVKRFLDRLGLHSVWDRFPVDYTHIHTDLKSTSTLDHFIVNERLLSIIEDCGVLHLGDNPSRHSPIMLKLRIDDLPLIKKKPTLSAKRPVWYKAQQEDKDNYTMDLHTKLSGIDVPASLQCSDVHCSDPAHSEHRDSFVIEIMSNVIESCQANIPMSSGKRCHPDPNRSCPVGESIPGWKEVVHPYREAAAFWHGVNGRNKVVEVFKNVYSELYNSSSTSDQMVDLKQLL